MELSINEDAFDELQCVLVAEIVAAVHDGLKELGLPREKLGELLSTIAFDVCCAIDSSTIVEVEGGRLLPVLTFAESEEFERVVSCGGPSWMHEYVHATADDYLANHS